MFTSAIILAAGSGRRMGFDKMTALLCGKAVILYSIERFVESNADEIIIAASEDNTDKIRELVSENIHTDKPIKIITGGATRFESAVKAVRQTSEKSDVVSVHDGARPLIRPEQVDEMIRLGQKTYAAAPALPVTDTVKVADMQGVVQSTPDRKTLFAVQTPQVFQADILRAALPAPDLQKRADKDPHHVMQEAVSRQLEAQFASIADNVAALQGANGGLFELFICAECAKIVRPEQKSRRLPHRIQIKIIGKLHAPAAFKNVRHLAVPDAVMISFRLS